MPNLRRTSKRDTDKTTATMEEFDILYYEENYKDGGCRFERDGHTFMMSESDDRYTIQVEPPFPDMVCTIKQFFPDTLTLMIMGHYLKHGNCSIGVWTTYDRNGEVLEETDYEEGWNVGWEALLTTLVAEKVNFKNIVSIDRCILNEETGEADEADDGQGNVPSKKNGKAEGDEQEGEEEVNEWLDEDDPFVEEDEAPCNPPEAEEPNRMKPQPVKCWIVTTLLSSRVMVDHYYSGDTGERLCRRYNVMK